MTILNKIFLTIFITTTPAAFATVDCDHLGRVICDSAKVDEDAIAREQVKSIIKNEAIAYIGFKNGYFFKNFNEFVFFKNEEKNELVAKRILSQYHVCINAMVIDLYDGKIPNAQSTCEKMGSTSKQISNFIGQKVKQSKLIGEFAKARVKAIDYFKTQNIIAYLNQIKFTNTYSSFEEYIGSAYLASPFENLNDSSEDSFNSACGFDGMAFNAYNLRQVNGVFSSVDEPLFNLKTQIAYCPGYIMAMINAQKIKSLNSLPTDQLRIKPAETLKDYQYSSAPENGRLVLYHEFAHCVTNFHEMIKYKDIVGKAILACFDQKFKNEFTYNNLLIEQDWKTKLKQYFHPLMNTSYFIDETLADHLAIKILATEVKVSAEKLGLIKNNARTYCAFGKMKT